ncbi:TonB-dependent receptor plug domain-containing protein [Arcticibacter eurypsychrophilus]|uniref:TonB-dependent receptor plug domain-containing protein n=1 Tax=Arcticibacter eurypsychrophilus TaxID=1434752 RepID=UPI00084D39DB|nr:TonB-dependent receptor [Arcticibacter eurypsychrophilus]
MKLTVSLKLQKSVFYTFFTLSILGSIAHAQSLDTLKSFKNQKLDEVSIAGKTVGRAAKEQAFNVNVIDAKKLYNSSADLNQVLSTTSGIRVREDGGVGSNFTFSLNGFSGRQVKFFLDGIPMDNFGSSLTLNNFPANMSERVEVYKGVLPINLGADALGGAVNIITRTDPNYLDVSYGYGSFNTHKASINMAYTNLKNGFTVRANAFYNYSDNNFKVKVQPIVNNQTTPEQEIERFHDGYQSATAQIEAGLTGRKYADKLLFGLIVSGNDKDIQTGVTMEQVYGARTTNSTSLIPSLKYKKINLFVKGLDLSFYTAYNTSRNNFIDTSSVKYNWLQETVSSTGGESRLSQLKNKDNEGLFTANLAYQVASHHTIAYNITKAIFQRKPSDIEDADNITFKYPQKLNKSVMGLAWQTTYNNFSATAFSKLYLLKANSYESISVNNNPEYQATSTNTDNLGYGAATAYFILPTLQAKASYEHTYRLPEATELLGDGLYYRRNSALKPEKSDNVNLGALYGLNLKNHQINLEANYIYRKSDDFIRVDQSQVQPIDRQYINIGKVTTNGVEGEIRYSWMDKLTASVNMTYQSIIDKEKFITSTNLSGTITSVNLNHNYRIPNMPYLFGNADLGYGFNKVAGSSNRLSLNYSLNFVQKYYLSPNQLGNGNDDLIPRQFAHNLMATYILNDGKYNISLECRNIGNNDLFDNYKLQKPGRSVFLKLRYFISK